MPKSTSGNLPPRFLCFIIFKTPFLGITFSISSTIKSSNSFTSFECSKSFFVLTTDIRFLSALDPINNIGAIRIVSLFILKIGWYIISTFLFAGSNVRYLIIFSAIVSTTPLNDEAYFTMLSKGWIIKAFFILANGSFIFKQLKKWI